MSKLKFYKYLDYETLRFGMVESLARYMESEDSSDLSLASAFADEALRRCAIDPVVRLCQARIMQILYYKTGKEYFARNAEQQLEIFCATKRLCDSTIDIQL
jgi:hypothetical protein